MLGAVAEAADDADQPLRPERDGSPGPKLPDQEHGGLPLQVGPRRERGHDEEGLDQLVTGAMRRLGAVALIGTVSCLPRASASGPATDQASHAPSESAASGPTDKAGAAKWADSVIDRKSTRLNSSH